MNVAFSDEQDDPLEPGALVDLARMVLECEGLPAATEVAITLVDADRIAELNESHLGKSGPTDVLSFPLEQLTAGRAPAEAPDGPPLALGDVLICPKVVRNQADEAGVDFGDEMALIVVHGLLHLLGYDHVNDTDAEHMESRERDLLAVAGRVRP